MNDEKIRQHFSRKYLKKINPLESILLNEVGIINGSSIVDIAAITKSSIEGFEIKSADDTLYRLPRQIHFYDKVFDFTSIITEKPHFEEVERIVPRHWGLILAEETTSDVNFLEIRTPTVNILNDDYSISLLLWKNEIICELVKRGIKGAHRERIAKLRKLLISIPDVNIREVVYFYLKTRVSWKLEINNEFHP